MGTLTRNWVVFLIFLALSAASSPAQEKHLNRQDSDDIYEAVVRYQIKTWDLAADSYCVEIQGKNPDKEFLLRFDPLSVKGKSGCREKKLRYKGKQFGFAIIDKKSGKQSVMFDAGAIRRSSPVEVEIDGGYVCAPECSAGGTYHVVREGAKWLVKDFKIHVIS